MSMSSVVILATDAAQGHALSEQLGALAESVVWLDRIEHASPALRPELIIGARVRLHDLIAARALWPDAALVLHHTTPSTDMTVACARLGVALWDGHEALPPRALDAPWRPGGEGLLCAARLARGDAQGRLTECLQLLVERWGADAAAYIAPEPGGRQHQVIAQSARDRLLVCLPAAWEGSWRALMDDPFAARLCQGRPERGAYPGCEPLWHRLGAGEVALLSVRPARGWALPPGALVVATLDPSREVPLGPALALARALELGRALDPPEAGLSADAEALLDALADPVTLIWSNLSVLRDYAEALALAGRRLSRAALAHSGPPTPMHEVWDRLARDEGLLRTLDDLEPLVSHCEGSVEAIVSALRTARHGGRSAPPIPAPPLLGPIERVLASWRRADRPQRLTLRHAQAAPLPYATARALWRALAPLTTLTACADEVEIVERVEGGTMSWTASGVLPEAVEALDPHTLEVVEASAAALARLGGDLEVLADAGALRWWVPVGATDALDD